MDTTLTVREARDRYLSENGIDMASYTRRVFVTRVGFVPLPFPNPGLLHLHDLHHVATGFATDLVGEAEISLFELRAGCRTFLIHLFCLGAIVFAMFLAPRRLLRAWRQSRGTCSLYYDPMPYDQLLGLPVAELRTRLRLPAEGLRAKAVSPSPSGHTPRTVS